MNIFELDKLIKTYENNSDNYTKKVIIPFYRKRRIQLNKILTIKIKRILTSEGL